ncbi:MAG: glycoside hydrolase family 99-like domain-containing protein [Eubacteriales bacterium]|nr:glycoside hydrolase family 99-like domain-containing protein [Eubacteriales bacterium]
MKKRYDIAAYVWPSYTGDEPRARIFWPEGIGEWQTVRAAEAKFPGHTWPRKPLWGYVNEADPYVMDMEINAAADHGVNVFIYDWYWYDGRPFLEQCLDNGFLKAPSRSRMRFYLMWANHDATTVWDKRCAERNEVVWSGCQDERQFSIVCDRVIERYFSDPCYYKIDGRPVFMIYDVENLIAGLGGLDPTRRCLDGFREKCVRAGFPGLELQLTQWGDRMLRMPNVSGVDTNAGTRRSTAEILEALHFDSLTNYQYVHFLDIDRDYREITADAERKWQEFSERYAVPYYPHVSLGWDNNPRFSSLRRGVVRNNTPENIEDALRRAKAFVDTHDLPVPLITINSWNEWTETSYLEPDDRYGYGCLEAVARVFGAQE